MAKERSWHVLLVDDEPSELHLVQQAWSECRMEAVQITAWPESQRVIELLRGFEPAARPPLPDLIMLDYHMPLDGGRTIVALKGDPAFLHIPLVVYTGNVDPANFLDCYRRGANAVYQKPMELQGYIDLVCTIADHWLRRVVLPPPVGPIP